MSNLGTQYPIKKYLAIATVLIAVIAVIGTASMTAALEGGEKPLKGLYLSSSDFYMTVIDPDTGDLIAEKNVGFWSGWPSNQYNGDKLIWWRVRGARRAIPIPVNGGSFLAINSKTLEVVADIPNGAAGSNFIEVAPNAKFAVGHAREPEHRTYIIDTDPDSPTFATYLWSGTYPGLGPPYVGGHTGPGPCDSSISSDGKYYWIPDRFSPTITAFNTVTKTFQTFSQPPLDPSGSIENSMGTVSRDDKWFIVENVDQPIDSSSIWDISDPTNAIEVVRWTRDGHPLIGTYLSNGALVKGGYRGSGPSDEFTFDMKYNFMVWTSTDSIGVVEMAKLEIVNEIMMPAGCQLAGAGDFSRDGKKFYVGARTCGVCKIDVATQTLDTCYDIGRDVRGVVIK